MSDVKKDKSNHAGCHWRKCHRGHVTCQVTCLKLRAQIGGMPFPAGLVADTLPSDLFVFFMGLVSAVFQFWKSNIRIVFLNTSRPKFNVCLCLFCEKQSGQTAKCGQLLFRQPRGGSVFSTGSSRELHRLCSKHNKRYPHICIASLFLNSLMGLTFTCSTLVIGSHLKMRLDF